jgi:ornithine cyclodeaminase/alanine dehydrogenase-like protein (mu-crystallin family)
VVAGRVPARRDDTEKVLVATVGLTTQDTAIAHALYLQAKDEGRGLRLPF